MDGAETGEALGQTAETVQGVDVGAGTVASEGVAVALQLLDGGGSGLIETRLVSSTQPPKEGGCSRNSSRVVPFDTEVSSPSRAGDIQLEA